MTVTYLSENRIKGFCCNAFKSMQTNFLNFSFSEVHDGFSQANVLAQKISLSHNTLTQVEIVFKLLLK